MRQKSMVQQLAKNKEEAGLNYDLSRTRFNKATNEAPNAPKLTAVVNELNGQQRATPSLINRAIIQSHK